MHDNTQEIAADAPPAPPRRTHVRVKPFERGAIQAQDGRWYLPRTDRLAAARAQRRFWAHQGTGIHWFVSDTGELVQAEETDQPTAPRAMRVRTRNGRICVSIGFFSRTQIDAGEARDHVATAAAEAVALARRGYRVYQGTWSADEFDRVMRRTNGPRIGPRTWQVLEAHLLHGIPLLTACRHVLRRSENPPDEKSVRNFARAVTRVIRSAETRRSQSIGHPTGCGEATLTAAATGHWSRHDQS